MFTGNELHPFYKLLFSILLVFFSLATIGSQALLKSYKGQGYLRNEIGMQVLDGMKLYKEGSVVFSMELGDPSVHLLRNCENIGSFATGKVGVFVYEGDVLELFCEELNEKKIVYVDSLSPNIRSLQKDEKFYLFDKKITPIGKMVLEEWYD